MADDSVPREGRRWPPGRRDRRFRGGDDPGARLRHLPSRDLLDVLDRARAAHHPALRRASLREGISCASPIPMPNRRSSAASSASRTQGPPWRRAAKEDALQLVTHRRGDGRAARAPEGCRATGRCGLDRAGRQAIVQLAIRRCRRSQRHHEKSISLISRNKYMTAIRDRSVPALRPAQRR
jgi:hypothetical protein